MRYFVDEEKFNEMIRFEVKPNEAETRAELIDPKLKTAGMPVPYGMGNAQSNKIQKCISGPLTKTT